MQEYQLSRPVKIGMLVSHIVLVFFIVERLHGASGQAFFSIYGKVGWDLMAAHIYLAFVAFYIGFIQLYQNNLSSRVSKILSASFALLIFVNYLTAFSTHMIKNATYDILPWSRIIITTIDTSFGSVYTVPALLSVFHLFNGNTELSVRWLQSSWVFVWGVTVVWRVVQYTAHRVIPEVFGTPYELILQLVFAVSSTVPLICFEIIRKRSR